MTASRPLVTKFRPICFAKGKWVGTMTPWKLTNEESGEPRNTKAKAKAISGFSRPPLAIAGFSRPSPLPPVLGPLLALLLLGFSYNNDE